MRSDSVYTIYNSFTRKFDTLFLAYDQHAAMDIVYNSFKGTDPSRSRCLYLVYLGEFDHVADSAAPLNPLSVIYDNEVLIDDELTVDRISHIYDDPNDDGSTVMRDNGEDDPDA